MAIGDIHASAESLITIARRLPLTDRKLRWTAADTRLVLTGDLCDRGYESKTLYSLVMQWQDEAPDHGSEVDFIIGNHEIMAVWGLSHYTTEEEYAGYGNGDAQKGREERRKAFSPGGWIHSWLLGQRFILRVGGIVFSHGDIPGSFSAWSIEEIEDYTRTAFVSGGRPGFSRDNLPDPLFSGSGSVLWCREAEYEDPGFYEPRLERFLAANKAELLVCGHTPSRSGRVRLKYSGRYLCIDTAMVFKPLGFGSDCAIVIEKGKAESVYFRRGETARVPLDLPLKA